MSKQPSIRWRDRDRQELRREIKNFNARLSYAAKKNPDAAQFLPERMSMKKAVETIGTRQEYNRLIQSLGRFNAQSAEIVKSSRGASASHWQIDEFKRMQRAENRRRTMERKKIEEQEVKIAGKGQGVTRAQMGSISENALKPSQKKFNNLSQMEWDRAFKSMERLFNAQARKEQREKMRENYIRGLRNSGVLGAQPDLEGVIRSVDIDTFIETVETDEVATFAFYNDPAGFEVVTKNIVNAWTAVANKK